MNRPSHVLLSRALLLFAAARGALPSAAAFGVLSLVAAACGSLSDHDLPRCERGEVDCPCYADQSCDPTPGGRHVACVDGLCQPPPAAPAAPDMGDPDACVAGTLDCACLAGACEAPLACTDAVGGVPSCQSRTLCPMGTLGCACYGDDSCDTDMEGAPLACDGDTCVRPDCQAGGEGCRCLPGDRCDDGVVCELGMCERDSGQTVTPPSSPRCYTPCRGSLVRGARNVECSAEGLLRGCIGDATCYQGSCLGPGVLVDDPGAATACRYDANCPDFQSCIAGHCYSDCEHDDQCREGRRCHRATCRVPCSAGADTCPSGEHCKLLDGQSGYCMPLGVPHSGGPTGGDGDGDGDGDGEGAGMGGMDGAGGAAGEGGGDATPSAQLTFEVSTRRLDFTTQHTAGRFRVTNTADRDITFEVSRSSHSYFEDGGAVVVRENPLLWLGLGVDVAGDDEPVVFTLAAGEDAELRVADAAPASQDNPAYGRWEGVLRVRAIGGASTDLLLTFVRSPEGRWDGSVFYFSNFGTSGYDTWRADPGDTQRIRGLGNALLRRWLAFADGELTLQDFKALLTATETESWRDPVLKARCPSAAAPDENRGCYPNGSLTGIGFYSDSLSEVPIPSGVVELPMVMLLGAAPRAADPAEWLGKVLSDEALHYPGDPAVALEFELDPSTCPPGADCINRVRRFDLDAYLGARYPTTRANLLCADAPAAGGDNPFEFVKQPWFVPGFLRGTSVDGASGRRYAYACQDGRLPFEDPAALAENVALSGGNPIADGGTLRRRVRLIDGALINQDTLFLLFEERFPSFFEPGVDDVAFGYILLERGPELPEQELLSRAPQVAQTAGSAAQSSCDPALVEKALAGDGRVLSADNAARVGMAMVTGVLPPDRGAPLGPGSDEVVHYYCWDTGYFDAGPDGNEPCPDDSEVTFFTLTGAQADQAAMDALPCQADDTCLAGEDCGLSLCQPAECEDCPPAEADDAPCGGCGAGELCRQPACAVGERCPLKRSCDATLQQWVDLGQHDIRLSPLCECGDDPRYGCDAVCGADRTDLRPERTFYALPGLNVLARPGIDEAVAPDQEVVHYLCHETGHIDLGPDGSSPCPASSRVTYFTVPQNDRWARTLSCQSQPSICRPGEACGLPVVCEPGDEGCREDRAVGSGVYPGEGTDSLLAGGCDVGQPCDAKGDCERQLETWRASGEGGFRVVESHSCEDPEAYSCDTRLAISAEGQPPQSLDLRDGKRFYGRGNVSVVLPPVDADVDAAFRYKTRFRNRAGTQVGFAPEACVPQSNAIPYCYDAEAIGAIADRVDCAAHIYTEYQASVAADPLARSTLQAFLTRTFSLSEETVPGLPVPLIHDGFERLQSELWVMLGDESVTRAFASRFDLAGQFLATFPGSELEPGGIDLSGGAGYEMFNLYQGIQYYQLVLDRFFAHAPLLRASLAEGGLDAADGFITPETAVTYLARVAAASSKKSRAWEQVAKRYLTFNQPDLSRLVIERAYASAYLESVVINQILERIGARAPASFRPQITQLKSQTALVYASALRGMRSDYVSITDAPNFYGIEANTVPFAPLDKFDINAFEKSLAVAQAKLAIATESEAVALADNRQFQTDSAQFQSELSQIKITYDNDLGATCGTFIGDDGGVYPAIPRYAGLSEETRALGDPCGLVGNGAIVDKLLELSQARIDADLLRQKMATLQGDIVALDDRLAAQCGAVKDLAQWRVGQADGIRDLNIGIRTAETVIDAADRAATVIEKAVGGVDCIVVVGLAAGTDCPGKNIKSTIITVSTIVANVTAFAAQATIAGLETAIENKETKLLEDEVLQECDGLVIDTRFDIEELFRRVPELELEASRVLRQIDRTVAEIDGLYMDAKSLMDNRAETEQLRINVEAARNDPNVRVYRNEAILTADAHFENALRQAYLTTQVFEYFTSQSYAAKDDLRLIRLAANGDRSLQDYLIDLQDAFAGFENEFGNPDTRLAVISLRDDIVPALQGNVAMSEDARQTAFRALLRDRSRLDPRGYLTLPFTTRLADTSPLTANHKVRYIEAELQGQDLGDDLGRVYVRQHGTGVIRGVDGELGYTTFPERTAVLNTMFNGRRGNGSVDFDVSIYRNERLRDRPFVNTGWDLVFNRVDEQVNADIELDELKDIVLYVYYTDFTSY